MAKVKVTFTARNQVQLDIEFKTWLDCTYRSQGNCSATFTVKDVKATWSLEAAQGAQQWTIPEEPALSKPCNAKERSGTFSIRLTDTFVQGIQGRRLTGDVWITVESVCSKRTSISKMFVKIAKNGWEHSDYDGDGLTNEEERKRGTKPDDPDSDRDGTPDKDDNYPLDKYRQKP